MECKFCSYHSVYSIDIEIIETYWNVNGATGIFSETTEDEIIETYWNVNRDSEKSATALFEGNNRNILEIYWNVNCRD